MSFNACFDPAATGLGRSFRSQHTPGFPRRHTCSMQLCLPACDSLDSFSAPLLCSCHRSLFSVSLPASSLPNTTSYTIASVNAYDFCKRDFAVVGLYISEVGNCPAQKLPPSPSKVPGSEQPAGECLPEEFIPRETFFYYYFFFFLINAASY